MRSYAAQDVISLPTLSASGAVALGQGLLTAAKAQATLPTLISTRLTALETVHKVLHEALSQKPQSSGGPGRARTADLAEDNAWGAFHDWLLGWTRVKQPEADQARAMYAVLFPNRLKFTKLPYQLEWAEADTRLTRIKAAAFEPTIEKLGGKLILEQLREAHQEYGEALGITAEGQDVTTPGIKEPLTEFTAALRAYVLAVAAHADPKDDATGELTAALLAPLYRWQSYITVSTAAAEGPPATGTPAGATPDVPAHPVQPGTTQGLPTSAGNGGQNQAGTTH